MHRCMRDLRLAQTPEDIQKATAYLQSRAQSLARYADNALKLVRTQRKPRAPWKNQGRCVSNMWDLQKKVADFKSELFALGGKLNGNAMAGSNTAAIAKSPELAKSARIREIELALRDASDAFNDARTAGWRYAATGDAAQATRASGSADSAITQLRKLRGEVEDKALGGFTRWASRRSLPTIKAVSARYVQVNDGIAAVISRQDAAARRRDGCPVGQGRGSLRSNTPSGPPPRQLSTEATVEHLGLGVGALAIIALIGTAVFGAFSIAKPIRAHCGSAASACQRQQAGRDSLCRTWRRSWRCRQCRQHVQG